MPIVIARIDERLVHGQIITSWVKHLLISRIVIVDDKIAKDEFMSQVLVLAAPNGITVEILSVHDAGNLLKQTPKENVMILFKNIEFALALVKNGVEIKDVNIGNMSSAPKRKTISRNVYMSAEEVAVAKELVELGVNVYLQMLHTDAKLDISKSI